MKPVCFVVMPFRTKAVTQAKEGAPKELNCDRLWDVAFRPALEALGYLPVRADLEPGSVIVKDMLNRLCHAELVLADISLQNGNVYYEIGVRHVARQEGCVLVAAEWFQPLFDVDYVRAITYPLKSGEVPDDEAAIIQDVIRDKLPKVVGSRTPYFELVDDSAEQAFHEQAEQVAAFQGELSALRLMRPSEDRAAKVRKLVERHVATAAIMSEVAVELVLLVRDVLDWKSVREFVETLPPLVRSSETVQEQYYLALSELGQHEEAIGNLVALSERFGATPERCGLIGGRYKRLYRAERERRLAAGKSEPDAFEREYLNQSIEYYERGMGLDLNEYYCSCNLPALYRARKKRGDEERAKSVDAQVVAACARAKARGSKDDFLAPTLFGAAFRAGDVVRLEELAAEAEAGLRFVLDTTLKDAKDWIEQAPAKKRDKLEKVLQRLNGALAAKRGI
ncbi:MAG TPA: TRAFs-binding domain-containing protein [Polyangiaceae bacterium]|jgi:hypothetical protein